jgi:hypothetical protein
VWREDGFDGRPTAVAGGSRRVRAAFGVGQDLAGQVPDLFLDFCAIGFGAVDEDVGCTCHNKALLTAPRADDRFFRCYARERRDDSPRMRWPRIPARILAIRLNIDHQRLPRLRAILAPTANPVERPCRLLGAT